jgi:hypothetical protein
MVAVDTPSFTSPGRVVADDDWPAAAPTDTFVAASGWLVLGFGTTLLLLHGIIFDRINPHSQ